MSLRSLPTENPVTASFWEAASRHQFVLQRCRECQRHVFYPRPACPHCGSGELDWVAASGGGEVYSYTVARRATHPSFADRPPMIIALVQLDEGPQLTTNIVGIEPDTVRIGQRVQVTFEERDGVTLPVFIPATR